MILPTKRLNSHRALIGIGADILEQLDKPKTISKIWDELNNIKHINYKYDWFVLALDLLYSMDAIRYNDGRVVRKNDI